MQVQSKTTKEIMTVIPVTQSGKMLFQNIVDKKLYSWEDLEPSRAVKTDANLSGASVNAVATRVGITLVGEIK